MTELDFINSGCDNRHCRFIFSSGEIAYGVITTFFIDEPRTYYLVTSPNMIEFQKYMNAGDKRNMKKLCSVVNLKNLKEADPVEKISFKPKARIAYQGLSGQAKVKASELILRASNNPTYLKQQKKIKIGDKAVYVIRLGAQARILIQQEVYGIIVIDIIFHR